jgi:hypothetical protein
MPAAAPNQAAIGAAAAAASVTFRHELAATVHSQGGGMTHCGCHVRRACPRCACIPGWPTCSRRGHRRSSTASRACLQVPAADAHAPPGEFAADGIKVLHDELDSLNRTGLAQRQALADDHRARRARRRHLHHPHGLVGSDVVVQAEAHLPGIEVLRSVNIPHRDGNDLEPHVHDAPLIVCQAAHRSYPRARRRKRTARQTGITAAHPPGAGSSACQASRLQNVIRLQVRRRADRRLGASVLVAGSPPRSGTEVPAVFGVVVHVGRIRPPGLWVADLRADCRRGCRCVGSLPPEG